MNHPILPCGFNADAINGDELDGAGTNWPIWPQLFDTFEGIEIVIITEEMLDIFIHGCPDLVLPAHNTAINFQSEENVFVPASGGWTTQMIETENNLIVWPYEARTGVVPADKPAVVAPHSVNVQLAAGVRTQSVRKRV